MVAHAVRALAGKSAQAAQQVKAIGMAGVAQVQGGTRQVRDAGTTINPVVTQVHAASALIQTLSGASRSQTGALVELPYAIVQTDEMSQRNAALAGQRPAAAMRLHQPAERLVQAVAVFKVGWAALAWAWRGTGLGLARA